VVKAVYFALLRLGNFKTSGCLVGRPTCSPATTTLTPQLVGISTITYNPIPTVSFGTATSMSPFICLSTTILDYYRSIFVTLILTSGLLGPVFKNKENTLSFNWSLSQKLHWKYKSHWAVWAI